MADETEKRNRENNLRPGEYKFTDDDHRKGGIASGIAKRDKKNLRLCLEMLLEKEMTTRSGETMSGAEAITAKLFEQALKGNVKAFETLRSTVGQDPVQKIMVADVEQSVIDEVEAMVRGETPKRKATNLGEGKVERLDPETGEPLERYKSISDAAASMGIDRSNLSKGIKAGKIVAGYKWRKRE